jgi:hypothetical protein
MPYAFQLGEMLMAHVHHLAPLTVVGVLLFTGWASAQDAATQPQPRLTASIGASTGWGEGSPAALLSVQVPVAKFFVLEGEATRRTHDFGYDVTTAAGNLLFRVRAGRVSMFAGGGLGVHQMRGQPVPYPIVCAPPDSQSCRLLVHGRDRGIITQASGGTELWFARRLGAFGGIHAGTAPEDGIRVFGGLRVAAWMHEAKPRAPLAPPNTAAGKTIRVTDRSGATLTGRLIALSESQVTFAAEAGGQQSTVLPLGGVRRIETVSHHARTGALIGAAAGGAMIAVAYSGDCADCEDRRITWIFPGIFGGIGAAVGGMINAATADRHVLYQAAGGSASIALQPVLGSRQAGVNVRMRW